MFLDRINNYKNKNVLCNAYFKNKDIKNFEVKVFYYIWTEYERVKAEKLYIDFNDIMILFNKLLDNPMFKSLIKPFTQFIIVDEFQDTNDLQMSILNKISNGNMAVVGDDAQSIYSFRGANIENILTFKDTYPETRVFKLEQNYRSTQNIVGAANSLISKKKFKIKKDVFSKNETGEKINILTNY